MAVAERTIRSVLGAIDEGVVSENQNGDFLTCNSAAERIVGLSAAEIGGQMATDAKWRAIHEDGSHWRGEDFPIKQALRTGRTQSEAIMGIQRPDGTLVWISIRAAPVVMSDRGTGGRADTRTLRSGDLASAQGRLAISRQRGDYGASR